MNSDITKATYGEIERCGSACQTDAGHMCDEFTPSGVRVWEPDDECMCSNIPNNSDVPGCGKCMSDAIAAAQIPDEELPF